MTAEIKKTILAALRSHRGDNYERAKASFQFKTPAQMQQRYGHSDETCAQILEGYRAHVDKVDEAITFVENRL